jgi:hypothetical protein
MQIENYIDLLPYNLGPMHANRKKTIIQKILVKVGTQDDTSIS